MKECPTCKTTYTDETLRFCLADGTTLRDFGGEQATFIRPASDPLRVQIPQDDPQHQSHFQPYTQAAPSDGGGALKIMLAIGGLLVLLLVVAGAAGALYYFNFPANKVANNGSPSPGNTASPLPSPATPSPKDDTADLRNQIANLEKMINEQKNQNRSGNSSTAAPTPAKMGTTARVNSPGDGFLALRSFPSSQVGTRITTIPHGATVSVAGCLNSSGVGNKSGRWCRASYNGLSGWVFDAYLIY